MPKRDKELEYEYDEEAEDEEFEEDDEYEDDEYEDDEEGGSGWVRKAIVAGIAILAIGGGGTYAYLQGMLPFSPKKDPEPIAASTSPYANPNGFGKVQASASMPSAANVDESTAAASKAAEVPPVEDVAKKKAPQKAEVTKAEAEKTAKVPEEPAADKAKAKKEAVKAVVPVVKTAEEDLPKGKPPVVAVKVVAKPAKPAFRPAARVAGSYAIQCGAFASVVNANNLSTLLNSKGFQAWVANGSGASSAVFSIRSTVVDSKAKADELKAKFAGAGHPGSIVPAGRGRYMLQLGIFGSRASADSLAGELKAKGLFVSVAGGKAKMSSTNRVFVGKFGSMGQAQQTAAKIRQQGVPAIAIKL